MASRSPPEMSTEIKKEHATTRAGSEASKKVT